MNYKYCVFRQDTCTLKFNADNVNFKDDGWYGVALTIEDFPRTPITVGNTSYNETTPLTQVPLQASQISYFVIKMRILFYF